MNRYIFSSFLLCLIILFFVIRIVVRAFNDERTKVINQKNKIETQRNQIHDLMERENRINQMKLNFFTNISHEFRTPLTLLTAPVELLMEKETDPEKITAYHTIRKNTEQLRKLVDSILDLRKLDNGGLQPVFQKKDITGFLEGVMQDFAPLAEVQKINLRFTCEMDRPFYMNFDAGRLEKAVSNILLNAFKFTPEGGNISVAMNRAEDQGMLEIKISDTGKGIPQELIDDIFQPFYQSPETMYGTGIGLTLASEYVKLHNGTIRVESRINEGSVFYLILPSDLETTENKAVENPNPEDFKGLQGLFPEKEDLNTEEEEDDEKKQSLLIVEDNDALLGYVRKIFSREYTILQAQNGREGYRIALENLPDVIISDIMMPEMDGMELCSKLKTDERTSHIPVILLTAKAAEADRISGLETGADDYIVKPFSLKELRARVKNLLRNREILRERFQQDFSFSVKDVVTNKTDERFLESAIGHVEKNMEDAGFGVPELVEKMNISRSLLHIKLKKLTNMAASEFIAAIRLKKAAQLLTRTDEPVSEIGYRVGYSDLPYFSSSFRRMYGVSPSEYRKKGE